MNRLLALALALAAGTIGGGAQMTRAADSSAQQSEGRVLDSTADDIVYSDWIGGCFAEERADYTCTIRREARSGTGGRLGFIAFGQGETSRFLLIEIAFPAPTPELSLVIKIDSELIAADGELTCWRGDLFCSTTMLVDEGLLNRLASGHLLTVETRQHEVKIQFPLTDFRRARAQLL
jgi:hypothetical protein